MRQLFHFDLKPKGNYGEGEESSVLGDTACLVHAWFGWARVETALRERHPLRPRE